MSVIVEIQDKSLVDALARLKGIPVSVVVRNAARDFASAAYKATPLAQTSRSEYYTFIDSRNGMRRYLHETQVERLKSVRRGNKARRRQFGAVLAEKFKPHKVRIGKGWSRATWGGVFAALGLPPKSRPARVPAVAAERSTATATATEGRAETTLTDIIRFDAWGRTLDTRKAEIVKAGFAAARRNIEKEVKRMMKRAWK